MSSLIFTFFFYISKIGVELKAFFFIEREIELGIRSTDRTLHSRWKSVLIKRLRVQLFPKDYCFLLTECSLNFYWTYFFLYEATRNFAYVKEIIEINNFTISALYITCIKNTIWSHVWLNLFYTTNFCAFILTYPRDTLVLLVISAMTYDNSRSILLESVGAYRDRESKLI